MLGDRNACCCNNKSSSRRNIEGAGTVPACAAGIHQYLSLVNRYSGWNPGCLFAHDHGSSTDLFNGFTLHPQGRDKRTDLGRGCLAAHDLIHNPDHLFFIEVFSFDNPAYGFSYHFLLVRLFQIIFKTVKKLFLAAIT